MRNIISRFCTACVFGFVTGTAASAATFDITASGSLDDGRTWGFAVALDVAATQANDILADGAVGAFSPAVFSGLSFSLDGSLVDTSSAILQVSTLDSSASGFFNTDDILQFRIDNSPTPTAATTFDNFGFNLNFSQTTWSGDDLEDILLFANLSSTTSTISGIAEGPQQPFAITDGSVSSFSFTEVTVAPVPLPAGFLLLGSALFLGSITMRRRQSAV